MSTSNYAVGVQSKSIYVEHSGRNASKGKGDPKVQYVKHKSPTVALYAERWERGLDIWTGEPLEGAGLEDWKNQCKRRKRLQ